MTDCLETTFTSSLAIFLILMLFLTILTAIFSAVLENSNSSYPTYFRNETIIEKYNYDYVTNQTYLTDIQFIIILWNIQIHMVIQVNQVEDVILVLVILKEIKQV